MPIIICTNTWIPEWQWWEPAPWIRENQVYVNITDYLYERTD